MTLTKNTPLRRLLAAHLAALIATSAWAQVAPATTETIPAKPPAPEKKIPVETKKTDADSDAPATGEDETIMLSPFEVVSDNKGYYAANTMSGTRLNSKIEDLGQPITVMTKEQMSDFAMIDINDVFDYMAGTEGTNSYSQFTTDRTGAVVDNVSLSPNSANRVRGIGSANIAFGNIAMTGRVPVDPLWMDALELSRGPNANIFGLGNASGTVNQVPATANLTRDFTRVDLRADSYEGWRASLDVNRMLIKNKLSVRASYAYQHTGFVRKPAEEDAKRLSFQIKAQPFKSTTISASYFGYKNTAVRPNYTTPRDYYTDWVEAGKPAWNPTTGFVTLANGQVYGNNNVLGSATPYTGTPRFFAGSESRSPFLIGAPGETSYWLRPTYTAVGATDPYANTSLPTSAGHLRIGYQVTGPSDTFTATQQPLYNSVARPISDKSIYDWTKINLAGNSKAWDDVDTYLIQLDQFILNTPKHTLAFQGAYLREDVKRLENQPMGPASVNSNVGQLQVDVNSHFLDGTPNPYFGRPYLRSSEPYLRDKPMLWDTYRAQGAYRVDFSRDDGWTKWLGTQQVLGYYEYKDQQNRTYNYRHTAVGSGTSWEQNYIALNAPLGLQSNANAQAQYLNGSGALWPGTNFPRLNEQYYVGSTSGGGIEYAPNYFPEGARVPYAWGSGPSAMNYDTTTIGWSPVFGGGLNNVNTRIKTMGGVFQSTFLDGKLVGTYGLREDEVFDRNAPFATLTPDLRGFDFGASNRWTSDWRKASGKTKTLSIVARPFRDIGFLKSQVSSGSGIGKFLGEVATSFSPTYNKSDNFIAQGPAYDLFLQKLPNQTGTSKDIGFWITALDNKLSIRYTYYDTKQLNLRDGDISTMAQRILRYEGFVSNDAWNLTKQTTAWLNNQYTGGTASDAQIAAAIQMPLAQYQGLKTIGANGTYAAVNDVRAKGHELEINYNPTRHWTVSASVTKSESINTSAGAAVDEYIAARMPIWTTLEDPRYSFVSSNTVGTTTTATYRANLGTPSTFNIAYANDPTGSQVIPNGANGNLLWWRIMGTPFNSGAVGATYNNTNSAASNFAGNVNSPMSVFRALIGRPRPQVREYNAKFNTKLNLAAISDQAIIKNMAVGGSVRYASKGSIGFYGKGYTDGMDLTLPANQILELDTNRPIYSPAETYVDLFVSYSTKLFSDKVKARFQLNVKNAFEDGGNLQPTQAFFDGKTATYRIIDPRQFILSANFEF
jgi:hypothetical protein